MDSRLVLARRELRSLGREKTIVLALAIQLFVAAFSSFLVVGLVSLYAPGATAGAYVVTVGVAGNASGDVAPVVGAGNARQVQTFDSTGAAVKAFDAGHVDAVLVADRLANGRTRVNVIAPRGSFETTLVVVQVKKALTAYERQRRRALSFRLDRRPLGVPPDPGSSPYFGFAYTVLLPVLAFLPAFISGSIAADGVAEELDRGTFELLRAAPLSVREIVDGKALAFVAIAPAQAACWFAFLAANGTPIAHPVAALLLVAAVAAALVGVGIAVALLAPKRREAQLVYSFGALAVFAAASLLPESPQNVVAKLAIGSATQTTWLTVVAAVAVAVLVYAGSRRWAAGLAG